MKVVIESDSDESVVFVDMTIDNKHAIDNKLTDTDTKLASASDSEEDIVMVDPTLAPLWPSIISIPHYLDGTQPVDVLEVFGRTVSAYAV